MIFCNVALKIASGIRTWTVCSREDSPPKREAQSSNIEAGLALLAHLGAEI